MNDLTQRHYVRLDNATQSALNEPCRHLYTTKSELMRRYVREGVRRESAEYAKCIDEVRKSKLILNSA